MIVSCWIILKIRNVSDNVCRENQKRHFMFYNRFFRKSCPLWDNVGKYDTAGEELCKLDSTHARSEYVIHVPFRLPQTPHEIFWDWIRSARRETDDQSPKLQLQHDYKVSDLHFYITIQFRVSPAWINLANLSRAAFCALTKTKCLVRIFQSSWTVNAG